MYLIVWGFRVKRGQEAAFRRAYGQEGEWVRLFRNSTGYLSTELLWDERDEQRCLTIDRWSTRAAYEAFRTQWQDEYSALDAAYESLTEQETLIGAFTAVTD
jgi:heme-degrading monooxygenase HmoA